MGEGRDEAALGVDLAPGRVRLVLDAAVLAQARVAGEALVELGANERALLAEMPWPLRRAEWLAGRRVAKALMWALGFAPGRVEILPLATGAPALHVDGAVHPSLTLSLSHTRRWAVAAVASGRVGVDACDLADGHRLAHIGPRVFSEGEAEACGAHRSTRHQASVWALKEAGLKLDQGGIFDPGARSITIASLEPPRLMRPSLDVALAQLPDAAVALARPPGASTSGGVRPVVVIDDVQL